MRAVLAITRTADAAATPFNTSVTPAVTVGTTVPASYGHSSAPG